MLEPNVLAKGIFETLISTANDITPDECVIGSKIMDLYENEFHGEGSIFFVADGNTGFKELVMHNMEDRYNRDYIRYYHKFDPLKLREKEENPIKGNVRNMDYSGWEKGEYYNDFLLPQKMHYKLLANLKTEKGVLAKLLLTKSKGKGNFSKQEIRHAQEITPYFAQALEHNRFKRKAKDSSELFKMIEENLNTGIILLAPSKEIVHSNNKAHDLCKLIGCKAAETKNFGDMPPTIVQDYLEMLEEYKQGKQDCLMLPRKRIFQSNANTFSVHSKFISDQNNSNYFLITMKEAENLVVLNENRLREVYHLSKREIEVVSQVAKGLSNSEIAENLYICVITVKKHLQNIFTKMGVNNRAALVQKVLSKQTF